MWWHWSEITLLESVIFSALSLLVLFVVGFGIVRVICFFGKRTDFFADFDFFQRTSFRILFGFIFVFLFVLIFSVFDVPFIFSSLFVLFLALVGLVIGRSELKFTFPKLSLRDSLHMVVTFCVLVVGLVFSSLVVAGHYGGTNDDSALHSLIVRVLLDNPHALYTRSSLPYANFVLDYPSGAHVLCGFFVSLFGVSFQKIILLVSAILPTLMALATYSSLKCLFGDKLLSFLGLLLVSFFSLYLTWMPVSWGGLPLLLSLYLSISILGLFYVFLLKIPLTWFSALVLGLLFFIAAETYPTALFFASIWFILVLGMKIISHSRFGRAVSFSSLFSRANLVILVAFITPILLLFPYFYAVYSSHVVGIEFSQVNPESISLADSVWKLVSFNWVFDIPRISDFFSWFGLSYTLAPLSLLLLIGAFVPPVSRLLKKVFPLDFRRCLFLVYLLFWSIMGYLTLTLGLQFNFFTALLNPRRVFQHIFIPGVVFTVIVLSFSVFGLVWLFRWLSHNRGVTSSLVFVGRRMMALGLLGLVLVAFAVSIAPVFEEQRFRVEDVEFQYTTFETLDYGDVLLISWINDYAPTNSNILVSMGDSGQFVMSMTGRSTVSSYNYLEKYRDLMLILSSNASDPKAIPILIEYKISHIYIGSIGTTYALENPVYRRFNTFQLISSSYFMPKWTFSGAWLFEFNATAALSVYNSLTQE